jgi:hypothetical protein
MCQGLLQDQRLLPQVFVGNMALALGFVCCHCARPRISVVETRAMVPQHERASVFPRYARVLLHEPVRPSLDGPGQCGYSLPSASCSSVLSLRLWCTCWWPWQPDLLWNKFGEAVPGVDTKGILNMAIFNLLQKVPSN